MRFDVVFPELGFLIPIEGTPAFPYRWRLTGFPLVVEAREPQPWGLCWTLREKIDMGKFPDGSGKYPSLLKLRLEEQAAAPSHEIETIVDRGKLAYYRRPCEFVAVLPAEDRRGFLIVAILRSSHG